MFNFILYRMIIRTVCHGEHWTSELNDPPQTPGPYQPPAPTLLQRTARVCHRVHWTSELNDPPHTPGPYQPAPTVLSKSRYGHAVVAEDKIIQNEEEAEYLGSFEERVHWLHPNTYGSEELYQCIQQERSLVRHWGNCVPSDVDPLDYITRYEQGYADFLKHRPPLPQDPTPSFIPSVASDEDEEYDDDVFMEDASPESMIWSPEGIVGPNNASTPNFIPSLVATDDHDDYAASEAYSVTTEYQSALAESIRLHEMKDAAMYNDVDQPSVSENTPDSTYVSSLDDDDTTPVVQSTVVEAVLPYLASDDDDAEFEAYLASAAHQSWWEENRHLLEMQGVAMYNDVDQPSVCESSESTPDPGIVSSLDDDIDDIEDDDDIDSPLFRSWLVNGLRTLEMKLAGLHAEYNEKPTTTVDQSLEVETVPLHLPSTSTASQEPTSRKPRRRRSPRQHPRPPTRRSKRIAALNRQKK